MLERILPSVAAVVSARGDVEGAAPLGAEEEAAVGKAVEKRRREFATARACAREALVSLGLEPRPIPSGPRGEPLWPAGVVGSITHCDGYRAGAVARASELVTIGVDAEPNAPLPDGILADVALPEEREWIGQLLRERPEVRWDRLLFSAKESVYKAWFPLANSWLGFEDASLELDPEGDTFRARLLVPGPSLEGRPLSGFRGRWMARDGLLLTAIAVVPGAASNLRDGGEVSKH